MSTPTDGSVIRLSDSIHKLTVADLFIEYLRKPDAGGIMLGTRSFTAAEMIAEIESDTECGRKLVRMFARHLRLKLGVTTLPSFDEAARSTKP